MAQGAGGFSQTIAESIEGFRQKDNYFKAQAGILGAWALVSLATIAVVAWTGRSENKLGADVRAEAAVGGSVLLITNTSTDAWTDITYTLNGLYIARQAELAPGDHTSLPIKRFRKGGAAGKHAQRNMVPQTLAIRCEEGQFETSISVIPGGISP
jgi:hypothetical protein